MAVIVSNDVNFQNDLSQHPLSIVKYFAEWCGSCKLFAPKFKRLSGDERFEGITFIDIDAETNPEARKLGNINNLPSFAIFKNGQLVQSVSTSKEEAVVALLEELKK